MTEIKREDLVTAIGFDPLKDRQRRVDYDAGREVERTRCLAILDEAWKSPKLTPATRMALAVVARRIRDPEHVSEPGGDSAAEYESSELSTIRAEIATMREANGVLISAVRAMGRCETCARRHGVVRGNHVTFAPFPDCNPCDGTGLTVFARAVLATPKATGDGQVKT